MPSPAVLAQPTHQPTQQPRSLEIQAIRFAAAAAVLLPLYLVYLVVRQGPLYDVVGNTHP